MRNVLLIFVVITFFSTFSRSEAQITGVTPADIMGTFSILTNPPSPKPDQDVTITIDGSGVNLSGAMITWSVNGSQITRGIGVRSVTISTRQVGTRENISVTVETGGSTYRETAIVTPGEIDLLWQGNTYTPPLFKGRSLWSNQSQITILAIPNVYNPSNSSLIYKWHRNGQVLGANSGTERSSLTFTDQILGKPQTIKLEIFSLSGTLLASQTLVITPESPSLLVYENSPLYGLLFHKEVGTNYSLREEEVTLTLFPLFFSANSKLDPMIEYSWKTNTGGSEPRNSVTYRAPENVSGSSRVTTEAKHRDKVIQFKKRDFIVQFENQ